MKLKLPASGDPARDQLELGRRLLEKLVNEPEATVDLVIAGLGARELRALSVVTVGLLRDGGA